MKKLLIVPAVVWGASAALVAVALKREAAEGFVNPPLTKGQYATELLISPLVVLGGLQDFWAEKRYDARMRRVRKHS